MKKDYRNYSLGCLREKSLDRLIKELGSTFTDSNKKNIVKRTNSKKNEPSNIVQSSLEKKKN